MRRSVEIAIEVAIGLVIVAGIVLYAEYFQMEISRQSGLLL
jgi:hypothetical protein